MDPLRDWKKLGKCQKVIQHTPGNGVYVEALAVNSEGLLAVTDDENNSIRIFRIDGPLGKGCVVI